MVPLTAVTSSEMVIVGLRVVPLRSNAAEVSEDQLLLLDT